MTGGTKMYRIKYPHLFQPIRLGNRLFRNRIFASPTGCLDVNNGNPTPAGIAFYERKARGGAAAVTIGDCIVDSKTGQITAYQIRMDNPLALPQMSAMAKAITKYGAVASVELQHGGMFSHLVYEQGRPLLGPVAMKMPDVHIINNDGHEVPVSEDGFRHIQEMSEEQILALINSFGKAARFAKQCGFGMIMIHAGHGWGLAQFLSPRLNTRKDKWGGSLENRLRLPLAVVEAVRKAVGPGFPIEIRISGAEGTPDGYDLEEGIRIAKMLDGKVDLIHVSAGHHESPTASMITFPSMFHEEGCNVRYAAEIKKHVKTPVATVGALIDPALMEEIIASGQADIVQMGRGLLADPDFPNKARMGLEEDINSCLRCFACLAHSTRTRKRACAINPEIGHELDFQHPLPPVKKKKILVAGGGVAGMQAAITAAQRGHSVILCEKSGELGGVLNCEKQVPFKSRLGQYLERQARRVHQVGVEVKLNTEVTETLAQEIAPDVIIAALGARPIKPSIPGIERKNVFRAEEIYNNPSLAGKKVVILGGGLVGTELAIYLASQQREVTIMEMLETLNDGGNMVHANALALQIERFKIRLALGTKAVMIDEKGVSGEKENSQVFYQADTVIYAVGYIPKWEECEKIRYCAPEFHQLGDCLFPNNILQATTTAYFTARDIGRIQAVEYDL